MTRKVCLAIFLIVSGDVVSETALKGAPIEASEYSFLIGNWRCLFQQFDNQGKVAFEAPCTWEASYAFDNKMVVDDFKMYNKEGAMVYGGRTLRTYSLQDNTWHQVFLPVQMNASLLPFTATKVDKEMHLSVRMIEPTGGSRPARFAFSNISNDAFTWQSHESHDGGKSWVLSSRISAQR